MFESSALDFSRRVILAQSLGKGRLAQSLVELVLHISKSGTYPVHMLPSLPLKDQSPNGPENHHPGPNFPAAKLACLEMEDQSVYAGQESYASPLQC